MDNKNQELELVEQSGRTLTFFAGLVIGSMVGAVTMLLMAPQPGGKTRTELQSGAIELRDRTATTMKDTMTQVKAKANQIKADVQIKALDLEHQGQDMLVKQLDHFSRVAEAGKKALQGSANHTLV
jgi:gas vesicle protein